MTTNNVYYRPVLALAGVLLLGGCETMGFPANHSNANVGSVYPSNGQGNDYSGNRYPATAYSGYGVVQSIDPVNQGSNGIGGSGIGLGTLAGAVVGGFAGHQFGKGSGNTAATVAGAAGGAYVGHELENRQQQPDAYTFNVRMDNGSYQTLRQSSSGGLAVGDRVRISNGVAQRY